MDHQNFTNQTFDSLPELIIGSNFENCTFNVAGHFQCCNIRSSAINYISYFDRSNVIECTGKGLDASVFEKSNKIDHEEIDHLEMEE